MIELVDEARSACESYLEELGRKKEGVTRGLVYRFAASVIAEKESRLKTDLSSECKMHLRDRSNLGDVFRC